MISYLILIINFISFFREIKLDIVGLTISPNTLLFLFISSILILICLCTKKELHIKRNFELIMLLVSFSLGFIIILSCNNIINLYLGIELFSIVTYILIYGRFNEIIKNNIIAYFIINTIFSLLILLNLVYNYYQYGSILINSSDYYYIIAVVLLFKFGITPFHIWMTKIYPGFPTLLLILSITMVPIFNLNLLFIFSSIIKNNLFLIILLINMIWASLLAIGSNNINFIFTCLSILNSSYLIYLSLFISNYSITESVLTLAKIILFILFYCINTSHFLIALKEKSNTFIKFSTIISSFSSIGVIPLVGFFPKLYIIVQTISNNKIIIIMLIIISIVFSTISYIKILIYKITSETKYVRTASDKISIRFVGLGNLFVIWVFLFSPYIIKFICALII